MEVIMRLNRASTFLAAGAFAILSASAVAQTTPTPRDPYTQGAATSTGTYDPYSSGARTGDKFDPYSQGANQATRSDLAPQSQTYQPDMSQSVQADRVGTSAYRGDMRWSGPMLGSRLGPRSRFLDGA
jgi:hypothetical protein